MGKIIITTVKNKDFLFLFDNDHNIQYIKNINNSIVDTIYKGRIDSINEGLNACFVSIASGLNVFVSLSEFKDKNPKCGDELLVQIKTKALKTKLMQGTINLCLPGQYCVCHLDSKGISVSKKLDNDIQNKLLDSIKNSNLDYLNDYKWVIRTNASYLLDESLEPLYEEMNYLSDKALFLNNEAKYRSLYSVVYEPKSDLLNTLYNIPFDEYDSIILDNENYYEEIKATDSINQKDITFYTDKYISLKNLHSLETYLDRALDKKVYLDCGGYLIIEPTEALTVIDVNSGKLESRKKESEAYIFKVNKEAAIEIAKQLKIRNISGIIIIDFINMKLKENNEKLLSILSEEFKNDKVMTKCIGMTQLGLVEITRKKIDEPLKDVFK